MKNRRIPYGYSYSDGVIVINKTEQKTVIRIFTQYIAGMSLRQIAEMLEKEKVCFSERNSEWNRPRVMRILDDDRYLGNNKFPKLLTENIFYTAHDIKQKRSTQENTDRSDTIYKIKPPIICPECGAPMKRFNDQRKNCGQRWKCQKADCQLSIRMPDNILMKYLYQIINRLASDPDIICVPATGITESTESIRLRNEVSGYLASNSIDEEKIKEKLFERFSQEYSEIQNTPYISKMLRAEFARAKETDSVSPKLINSTIRQIIIHTDNSLSIILMNGQEITMEGIQNARKCSSAIA